MANGKADGQEQADRAALWEALLGDAGKANRAAAALPHARPKAVPFLYNKTQPPTTSAARAAAADAAQPAGEAADALARLGKRAR